MALWIKICGVTSVDDARLVVRAGADAVGLNLVPSSKRCIDRATAGGITRALDGHVEVVLVVADLSLVELVALQSELGPVTLQLHGSEPPELLRGVLPRAYKAVRIGSGADVTAASAYAGSRLLTDAKVEGALGGTGHRFDWSLVTALARERALVLAGGLTPETVGAAVAQVRPYGVDTASGVEGVDPRRKDAERVSAFVVAARHAAADAGLDAGPAVDYQPGRSP